MFKVNRLSCNENGYCLLLPPSSNGEMFAVIIFEMCICSFVWECEWYVNVNAKHVGLT